MDYDRSNMAPVYDSGRAYAPKVLEHWLDTVSVAVRNHKVSRILDVGCGTGRYSGALAEYFSADVVAIDPSQKMLTQARTKARSGVRILRARAEQLPLTYQSIDLVFMSMVFHHLDSPEMAAHECKRVLRANGKVCLRAGTREQIDQYPYVRFFDSSVSILRKDLQSRKVIESVFAQAGFWLTHHELVRSEIAGSWHDYASKLAHRADSILAQLSDEEFQAGLASVRQHAESQSGAGPVVELIDFFVFCKDGGGHPCQTAETKGYPSGTL